MSLPEPFTPEGFIGWEDDGILQVSFRGAHPIQRVLLC